MSLFWLRSCKNIIFHVYSVYISTESGFHNDISTKFILGIWVQYLADFKLHSWFPKSFEYFIFTRELWRHFYKYGRIVKRKRRSLWVDSKRCNWTAFYGTKIFWTRNFFLFIVFVRNSLPKFVKPKFPIAMPHVLECNIFQKLVFSISSSGCGKHSFKTAKIFAI